MGCPLLKTTILWVPPIAALPNILISYPMGVSDGPIIGIVFIQEKPVFMSWATFTNVSNSMYPTKHDNKVFLRWLFVALLKKIKYLRI